MNRDIAVHICSHGIVLMCGVSEMDTFLMSGIVQVLAKVIL